MNSSENLKSHSCDIAIVGGGCSGVLTAVQLLRKGFRGRIAVIEMRPELGRGVAYSTTFEQHLLNVPAAGMSAFPDDPTHFLEWLRLQAWSGAAPDAFAPRMLYARYLADLLRSSIQSAAADFRHVRGEVVDAEVAGGKAIVRLSDGSRVEAARVVLALGNPASVPLTHAREVGEQWHDSPWFSDALRVRFPAERILLVGAGLTAVDSVLALHSQQIPCTTFMISRRGILPQAHNLRRAAGSPPVFENPDNVRLMFRQLRTQIGSLRDAGQCWRTAVDALRPVSNDIWRRLSVADRERFLRHLKTYWEVHRHRMSPQVRQRVEELIALQYLKPIAGRIRRTALKGRSIEVTIALRDGGESRLGVDRAINCTGIHENYRHRPRRFIGALIENGLAAPNDLGIGFRSGEFGELIDARDRRSNIFFTLGPPRRGDLFETTAVPEIRLQAEALARHLVATTCLHS